MTATSLLTPPTRQRRLRQVFSHWLLLVLLAALLANLIILGFRIWFIVSASDQFETTGTEGVGIYAVWKVRNGHPLYEWPNRDNYAMSIFNFLMYELYGNVMKLLPLPDARIPSMARLMTLSFALGAIIAHRAVVSRVIPSGMRSRAVGLMVLIVTTSAWIGRSSVSWWAITARPDLPAAFAAICGLVLLIDSLERDQKWRMLAASVMFYFAWSFKQSAILTFVGALFYLSFHRRFRAAATLFVPFVALVGATVLVGGPAFRFNTLLMPSLAPFELDYGASVAAIWVAMNPLVWLPPVFVWIAVRKIASADEQSDEANLPAFNARHRIGLVATMALISTPLALAGVCRVGASGNYFFEPMAHLTTLTVMVLAWCMQSNDHRRKTLARIACSASGLWAVGIPLLTLAFPHGLNSHVRWNLVYSNESIRKRQAFFASLEKCPRPLMTDDTMLAQPWWSTGDKFPALVTDSEIFILAQRKGLIPANLKSDLLLSGVYAAAVAPRDSELARTARARGFVATPLPPCAASEADDQSFVLLTRTRPGSGPGSSGG